jgi:hypothetical protein
VYVSSAVEPFTSEELSALLDKCRRNNEALGITGMLLYRDGNFMQAIEGPQDAVSRLHAKIENDPRHRGMLTLVSGPAAAREFTHWSMGFRDLGSAEVRGQEGFSEFLNTPLTAQEFGPRPMRCQKLLSVFKKNVSI